MKEQEIKKVCIWIDEAYSRYAMKWKPWCIDINDLSRSKSTCLAGKTSGCREPNGKNAVYKWVVLFWFLSSVPFLSWNGHKIRLFSSYRRALTHKAFVLQIDHHFKERILSWMWLLTIGKFVKRSHSWSITAREAGNRITGIILLIPVFGFPVWSKKVLAGIRI